MTRNEAEMHEERLAELIAELPPAPAVWVEAAQQLPRIERGVEQILALAEADAELRETLGRDLEEAVRRAGQEPSEELVRALRGRLDGDDPGGA